MVGQDQIGIHGRLIHKGGKADHKGDPVASGLNGLAVGQRIAGVGLGHQQRFNSLGGRGETMEQMARIGKLLGAGTV